MLKFLLSFVFIFQFICFQPSWAAVPLDHEGLPVIAAGEIFFRAPETTHILCQWNLQALNWGTPVPGRRDQGFEIQRLNGSDFEKVGEILTQFILNDYIYGPHVRIRSININPEHQHNRVGTQAMKLILDLFSEMPLKLEVNTRNYPAQKLFHKLGFSYLHTLAVGDVEVWVKNYDPARLNRRTLKERDQFSVQSCQQM